MACTCTHHHMSSMKGVDQCVDATHVGTYPLLALCVPYMLKGKHNQSYSLAFHYLDNWHMLCLSGVELDAFIIHPLSHLTCLIGFILQMFRVCFRLHEAQYDVKGQFLCACKGFSQESS